MTPKKSRWRWAQILVFAVLLVPLVVMAVSRRSTKILPDLDWSELMSAQARLDHGVQKIDYPITLKQLDGRPVTLHAWISPINLGDGTTVTSFLATGTPGTCPFCLGIGPEGFVLVSAAVPVPADPTVELLLQGRFELTPNDSIGFYYRLRDAHASMVPN